MLVAFDQKKPVWVAEGGKLRQADGAKFGAPAVEIGQAPGDIGIIGIDLGEEPCSGPIGIEEADNGLEVDLAAGAFDGGLGFAVGDQLGVLVWGQEFHGECLLLHGGH